MPPYIILDRDGVINFDSDEYIKSPEEWQAIPGSLAAIAALNRAGYKVLIATNQSGVARGYYDLATLERIHEKMCAELAEENGVIEKIFFCPHHPNEGCLCRKPKSGMLKQMAAHYPINWADCYFVGDSQSDIAVAEAMGCKPILVKTGKGERTLAKHPELAQLPVFANLAAAVKFILSASHD